MTIVFKRTKLFVRTLTPKAGPQLPEHLCILTAQRPRRERERGWREGRATRKSATSRTATRKCIPGLAPHLPRGSMGGHCINLGAHMAPISLVVPVKLGGFSHPIAISFLDLKPFWRFWRLSAEMWAASCHVWAEYLWPALNWYRFNDSLGNVHWGARC